MAARPLQEGAIKARQEYVAPLFEHLRAHHYRASVVAYQASVRGGYPFTAVRVWRMIRGRSITPPWFVAECCAVIGRPIAEVMGADWVRRFGVDGRGGTEMAPVRPLRVQRPSGRTLRQPAYHRRRGVRDPRHGGSERVELRREARQASEKESRDGRCGE